jgi:hypothetical protein
MTPETLFIILTIAVLIIAVIISKTARDAMIIISIVSASLSIYINQLTLNSRFRDRMVDWNHPSRHQLEEDVYTGRQPKECLCSVEHQPKECLCSVEHQPKECIYSGEHQPKECIYSGEHQPKECICSGGRQPKEDFQAGAMQVKHLIEDKIKSEYGSLSPDLPTDDPVYDNTKNIPLTHTLPAYHPIPSLKKADWGHRVPSRHTGYFDIEKIEYDRWRNRNNKAIMGQKRLLNPDIFKKYFQEELDQREKSQWWGMD